MRDSQVAGCFHDIDPVILCHHDKINELPITAFALHEMVFNPAHRFRQFPIYKGRTITQGTRFALQQRDIMPRLKVTDIAGKAANVFSEYIPTGAAPRHKTPPLAQTHPAPSFARQGITPQCPDRGPRFPRIGRHKRFAAVAQTEVGGLHQPAITAGFSVIAAHLRRRIFHSRKTRPKSGTTSVRTPRSSRICEPDITNS